MYTYIQSNDILKEIKMPTCVSGPALGLGQTQTSVETAGWIESSPE